MSKFINTETFEIREDFFEVDNNIAGAISLLNKKGYITEQSCEGHIELREMPVMNEDETELCVTKMDKEAYITFAEGIKFCNIPEGWSKTELEEEDKVILSVPYPNVADGSSEDLVEKYEAYKKSVIAKLTEWVENLPYIRRLEPKSTIIDGFEVMQAENGNVTIVRLSDHKEVFHCQAEGEQDAQEMLDLYREVSLHLQNKGDEAFAT